jgi:molybdopterin-synthase adenylyltransferase
MRMGNNRQSFLGKGLDDVLESCLIGVVGLGGGGSQIVQQLAHIGFQRFVLYDYDNIEDTNLNRLVGATKLDIELKTSKMEIATRLIRGLSQGAFITEIRRKWQEESAPLQSCDIIFGCLDGYQNRSELEALARRSLVPYIDVGMDVKKVKDGSPRMSGQVIASIPGFPCMRCFDFLNESVLADEAKAYGAAGVRPQVIWPNSQLVSTAVSIAMNLLMNWTKNCDEQILYYEYDGNKATIKPHLKDMMRERACPHHMTSNVGDVELI